MSKIELEGNIIRIPKEECSQETPNPKTEIPEDFIVRLVDKPEKSDNLETFDEDMLIDLQTQRKTEEINEAEELVAKEVLPGLPDEFYAQSDHFVLEPSEPKIQSESQLNETREADEVITEYDKSEARYFPASPSSFKHSNPLRVGSLTAYKTRKKPLRRLKRKIFKRLEIINATIKESCRLPEDQKWQRPLVGFMSASIACAVLVFGLSLAGVALTTKEQVLGDAVIATDHIKQAGDDLLNGRYQLAAAELRVASKNFQSNLGKVEDISRALNLILSNLPGKNPYKSAIGLLRASQEFSLGAAYLANGLTPFNHLVPLMQSDSEDVTLESSTTLTEALVVLLDNLTKASTHFTLANQELAKTSPSIVPKKYRKEFQTVKGVFNQVIPNLTKSEEFLDNIIIFLGHQEKKRYLLLFQNHTEIRATGGFIGSLAVLDFDRGQVTKLEVEGIYDPAGQLVEKVAPPEPLRFTNNRWNIQDSNWLPDFPSSAEKIAWFYEKTGGPSVDGIIALTPEVITELLKLTGPISMPDYDTVIDANNFLYQTQREVELEYDREENKPKKFISDLAPKLIDKVLNGPEINKSDLVMALLDLARRKQVILYSFDEKQEEWLAKYDLAGRQKTAPFDYLSVVNSNITGGKTDNLVKQDISVRSIVDSGGQVTNFVEITRKHTGTWEWPSTKNLVYQRIYVPLGSQLVESKGFDMIKLPEKSEEEEHYQQDPDILAIENSKTIIKASGTEVFEENGYTVFGNWIAVQPGETKTVSYKYILPEKLDLTKEGRYSLLAQKQLGGFSDNIEIKLYWPNAQEPVYIYPASVKVEPGVLSLKDQLDRDLVWGFVWK